MKLAYAFTEEEFVAACVEELQRDGSTVCEDIFRALSRFLANPVANTHTNGEARSHFAFDYYDKSLSLLEYIEAGSLEFPHQKLTVYGPSDADLDIEAVGLPAFLTLDAYNYGLNGLRSFKIKQSKLKTKSKAEIQFNCLKVNASVLQQVRDKLAHVQSKLIPSRLDVYEWRQTFYNKISGDCFLCECFRKAVEASSAGARDRHVERALAKNSFKEDICHLCTGANSSLSFCDPIYGSAFKVRYGAYITKISIEQNLDERAAENLVREMKGVAKIGERWVNETLLFNYIKMLFPNHVVEREASPAWIGKQRLDVYIPALGLAVEYQGKQHYEAIRHFGGDEGLTRAQERDKLKAKLCKQNNVDLVYFTYTENLTEKLVDKRLKKYVEREASS